MALMLPARPRGEIAPRSSCKLSSYPPPSIAGWRGKSRTTRAIAADRYAATAMSRPFYLPGRQVPIVISGSHGIPRGYPRRQQYADFAGRCAWKP